MSDTVQRRDVMIWCTWLAAHLAGERHCDYQTWFRAHFTAGKRETGSFSLSAWKATHDERLNARVAALREDGYTVSVEDQNSFKLKGQRATLSGKPDIIRRSGDDCAVLDIKTGSPKDRDHAQMLVYLYALPRARRIFPTVALLEYPGHTVTVRLEELTPDVVARIGALMRKLGGAHALPASPSFGECSQCDVLAQDCPDRMDVDETVGETEEF